MIRAGTRLTRKRERCPWCSVASGLAIWLAVERSERLSLCLRVFGLPWSSTTATGRRQTALPASPPTPAGFLGELDHSWRPSSLQFVGGPVGTIRSPK